jgi:hypothetical protein
MRRLPLINISYYDIYGKSDDPAIVILRSPMTSSLPRLKISLGVPSKELAPVVPSRVG